VDRDLAIKRHSDDALLTLERLRADFSDLNAVGGIRGASRTATAIRWTGNWFRLLTLICRSARRLS
jgi:hypothetical protein